MSRPLNGVAWLAVMAVLAIAVAACGDDDEPGGRDLRIAIVTHGSSSDPFWSVVANGINHAREDLGVQVEHHTLETFDLAAMAQLIERAVASRPDGLVISIPDAAALAPSIRAAVETGIPVISINSGSDVYASLGIVAHVGQTEYEAGFSAGQRMAEAGVTNTICVNHEPGNAGLDLRCRGFADGLGAIRSTVIAVDLADSTAATATITSALSDDRSIDGVLTLGPAGAAAGLAAVEASGRKDQVRIATFDLSEDVLSAVDGGTMLFAVDQQPYLQGYMGVLIVTQLIQYGLLPGGGGPILTGPGFVVRENAAQVTELSAQGIR